MEKILYDITAERILEHLNDIDYYSDEAIIPYWEFSMHGNVYYLTSGGFLYRKDPGAEGVGGIFCGCLTNGAWHPERTG